MNLREINWRFALYSSGLLGGVVWAILASVVIGSLTDSRTTDFRVPIGQWLLIGATSLALVLIGATLTRLGRSIPLRSLGIGLVVSALAGWVMIAWITVQVLFGG
jgi:hypothetical protein